MLILIIVAIIALVLIIDWLNKSNIERSIKIWNDAKCPDCGVEWITKPDKLHINNKGETEKAVYFYCPQCDKEIRILPDIADKYCEGAIRVAEECQKEADDNRILDPRVEQVIAEIAYARELEKQAKNNKPKMF